MVSYSLVGVDWSGQQPPRATATARARKPPFHLSHTHTLHITGAAGQRNSTKCYIPCPPPNHYASFSSAPQIP